jgi:hypothetical protein
MPIPSIKGAALQSVTEDVHRLRNAGRLSESLLAAHLKPEDLHALDEITVPGLWYPIATYGRLLDLLCEVEGRGRPEYLVDRGARAAERLMAAGAWRHVLSSADRWGDRAGEAMIQVAKGFYNFTEWVLEHHAQTDRYTLSVKGAGDFPDAARYAAQGFVQVLFAKMGGRPVDVTSVRPSPDRIVYEIRR